MGSESDGWDVPAGGAGGGLPTVAVDRCPVCGCGEGVFLFEVPDFLHGVQGRFRYERCEGCGSAYQNPRVREERLPELYPVAYYTHAAGEGPSAPGGLLRGARERLREGVVAAVRRGGTAAPWWGRLLARSRRVRERAFRDLPDPAIPRPERPGRALEIGPGSGEALELLHRAGWEVEGLEWDSRAARVAAERSGRPVRVGRFPEAGLDEGAYDLVYMAHVLEHLPEPAPAVRAVRRLLRPGGRAVLLYPNPRSLGARRFGPHWVHWDPPRHLVLPSLSGIVEIARAAGLEVTATTRTREAAWTSARSRRRARGSGEAGARVALRDRGFRALEALLVALGRPRGEEVSLVLRPTEEAPGAEGPEAEGGHHGRP